MPDSPTPNSSPAGKTDSPALDTSPETLARCAQLLADGEIEWPQGLAPTEEATLLSEARRLRRARLVRLIAQEIGADMARSDQGEKGEHA